MGRIPSARGAGCFASGGEIGRRGGIASEVLSGLNEGDVVVVHPDRKLEHGMRIRVQ